MTDLRRAHSTVQAVFSGLAGSGNQVVVAPAYNEVAILHRVIFSDSVAVGVLQFNSGADAIGPAFRSVADDTPDFPDIQLRAVKGQTLNFQRTSTTALSVFVEYSLTRLRK
jgi:hypothetical protein